ncbi:Polyketide biosynthesis 3-hydroxy-3 -methylglutaryl-ACP synthase pksG [Legionella beliardensis]|uniref:Polyketide biosynthesis 3-hydroxy-3 -methylglutaryl-ACP synthase pksG n=1 Tax=Legionella beliardensis TaxID=91822 RepID=A0A378I4G2_9GAMM|nr:hydroxymethylglutaryl-CoA synthase [Legionella beliardensis]STX29722.1 Polyketide biosynthesis 3-hydroxy-3 -methylglutaryl-ACP synthase pksG [Legionella beliardensis]
MAVNHHKGIASIGLHIPSLALNVEELAKLRNVDPDKYTIGLGCQAMALCPEDYGIVELATEAARRALSRWEGDLEKIAIIAVGTESAIDMSRPLSAWVADNLGLKGAVRSYEVKHACYGGTLAIRQALEWKLADILPYKAALVIAADIALYEEGNPGEPTQGAGAVALIIDEPNIAEIDANSYVWSEPAFDFWRPEGEAYPHVQGQYSLECYQRAATECFRAMINSTDKNAEETLKEFKALCFHVPFPKMVKKAFSSACHAIGWDDEKIEWFFSNKIAHTMAWNTTSGNAYTASLWISVANALCGLEQGEKITAFSYGSGFGSELLILTAGPLAKACAWQEDFAADLEKREYIDVERYQQLRQNLHK